MQNRQTFLIEFTKLELETIIYALENDARLNENETFRSFIEELKEIKKGL